MAQFKMQKFTFFAPRTVIFSEKSSEGVLKPIVEQKSCDEKRTPPSSKNFVFRSHLLFKRRNILYESVVGN